MMWDFLPIRSLLDLQREAALKQMGQQAKELLDEGYAVDADRVLDEMIERRRRWQEERRAA